MIILSTNNPMLPSKLYVLSHNSIPSGQIWNIPSQTGIISSRWLFEYHQPYVILKIECFVLNSIPKWSELKKMPSQIGVVFFFKTIILSTNNPMLSSKLSVLSHISIPSGQIWKIPSWTGGTFLRWSFWVPTALCYLQNCSFCPIFLFISILFALCLHNPYFFFYFSSAILIALNGNFELSVLM